MNREKAMNFENKLREQQKVVVDKLMSISSAERKEVFDRCCSKKLFGSDIGKKLELTENECDIILGAVTECLMFSRGKKQSSELCNIIYDTFDSEMTDDEKKQLDEVRMGVVGVAASNMFSGDDKRIYDRNGILINRKRRRKLGIK